MIQTRFCGRRNRNSSLLLLFLLSIFITGCATTKSVKINSRKSLNDDEVFVNEEPYYFQSKEELLNSRYIFIRLYHPVYKRPWSSGSILQKGIDIVEVNNIEASHAAIGFSLKDEFYGLTLFAKPNLKVEHCTDTYKNEYMRACKPHKSLQTVLGLKVTVEEYEKIQSQLYKFLEEQNISYDVTKNFQMAMLTIGRKVNSMVTGTVNYGDNFPEGAETISYKITPAVEKKEKYLFVCSTFISYILYNSVKSYRNWIDLNGFDWNNIGPSDFINFKEFKVLFSSTWRNYNKAANAFLENKEWFKIFLEE